ncbi:MAG: HAD-IA family hydrolase [Humidesulfovibrio sp.]|uniref:HAD-IA family hydrolase n=1 Tax=Humidesulfovibrio sp. TaxID=2910988 RepID=UPI0027F16776|nr:HAD-IA family hydrolase [Humidesulfovibrio sp.]MDQ7835647.1 HAD-IA family hydrolase [Humidesulfovibrio sp.]
MALRALLWDVDGTMVDSEELHRRAFNLAFAEAGLDWSWSREEYARLLAVAGGKERMRHFADARMKAGISEAMPDIAALHRSKTSFYTRLLDEGAAPLRPGVARLMREASACGLRQAIVTTTSLANVRALQARLLSGVLESWDVEVTGESVLSKKPAPDAYLLALEQLGLRASDCLALEDSGLGISSARLAGVPTLVTRSQYTTDDDFCGALAILDHLGEPELPCHKLFGPPMTGDYVNLELLEQWHMHLREQREHGRTPTNSRLHIPHVARQVDGK